MPTSIINKQPSAELWVGQNDEEELGITYEKIDNFIFKGTTGNKKDDNLIETKMNNALHKIESIPLFCN